MSRKDRSGHNQELFDPGGKIPNYEPCSSTEDLSQLLKTSTLNDNESGTFDSESLALGQGHDLWAGQPASLLGVDMSKFGGDAMDESRTKSTKRDESQSRCISAADGDGRSMLSQDSGIASGNAANLAGSSLYADSGLDSELPPLEGTRTLPLDSVRTPTNIGLTNIALNRGHPSSSHLSITSSDQGYYDSLHQSDFSSLNSSIGLDLYSIQASLEELDRTSPVPYRSHSSRESLKSRKAESWHDESPHKKLRDYARKMNYTDTEIDQCMQQVGPTLLDQDRLLHHLMNIRELNRANPLTQDTSSTQTKPKPRLGTSNSASNIKAKSASDSKGDSNGLRRIVVDGSNVAYEHGLHRIYSCKGIQIVVDYFRQRGHEHITVFVPAHRLMSERRKTKDAYVLNQLCRQGVVLKTPSRKSSRGNIASYEDRFVLKLASMDDAIVVSNDKFRDLQTENAKFRETIEKRILPFVFANDQFIPAEDPLGKRGPTLEQFLRVNPLNTTSGVCPYGRKCTYGIKCKYGHPEREESHDSAIDSAIGNSLYSGISGASGISIGDVPASGTRQPDYWAAARAMPFEQYAMNSGPSGAYLPAQPHYPYQVLPQQQQQQRLPYYYQPVDNIHRQMSRYPAEHPQLPMPVRQTTRLASQHTMDNVSYHSNPLDSELNIDPLAGDIKLHPRGGSQDSLSATSLMPSTAVHSSSVPLPLDEKISSLPTPSQCSTHVAENRYVRMNPLGAPITESDSRYKLYFHLKHIFPEKLVRRVMNKHKHETDANKITSYILAEQNIKPARVTRTHVDV